MAKKRKYKKKQKSEGVYTIVMFLIAIVLFFILKIDPSLLEDLKMPEYNLPEATFTKGEMSVHFIDVGQGDCTLLRLPLDNEEKYKNILIDSGESGNGKKIINYLENLGISTLDALIASHPHSDHIGSMDEIIRRFNIKSFYMPPFPESLTPITSSYEDMLDELNLKGIKIRELKEGDVLNSLTEGIACARLSVLAPKEGAEVSDLNNVSLIMKLQFGEVSFLFTGDAEMEEYESIKGKIGRVDVLKAGHHGASNANGKELLYELRPEYAVISCGKNNDYGHPHNSVLNTFKKIDTEIFRTDLKGTIVIKTDGTKIITE